jgi:hypothetical protein
MSLQAVSVRRPHGSSGPTRRAGVATGGDPLGCHHGLAEVGAAVGEVTEGPQRPERDLRVLREEHGAMTLLKQAKAAFSGTV